MPGPSTAALSQPTSYCHSCLICHRDIKPENIFLGEAGVLKLGDFGMASMTRGNLMTTSCGSAHYASPEIIKGAHQALRTVCCLLPTLRRVYSVVRGNWHQKLQLYIQTQRLLG